jgi:tetratricopeptide (TPR) repeat protein
MMISKTALLLAAAPLFAAGHAARAADYGAYLSAQYAASQGNMDQAASGILQALGADPDNIALQRDAFGLSLLAGRPDAVRLAPSLPTNPIALLLLADKQAQAGNWQAAELAYAELPHDNLLDAVKPLLLAWAQQAQGHTDKALDSLQAGIEGGHLSTFYVLHAALIADVAHRDGEAARFYDQVAKTAGEPNVRLAQFLASWQARSGQVSAARATIVGLADGSPDMAIAIPGLLADIGKPQVVDAKQGIAEVYVGIAGALRRDDKSSLPGMVLQLALQMQPDLTEAHLVEAEMAGAKQQYAEVARILSQIPANDPLAAVVQMHLADVDGRIGKTGEALALLDRLAAEHPDRPDPLIQKGDLLTGQQHYDQAVDAYTKAMARVPHPGKADWFLYYARGAAYERSHMWMQSEADMQEALKLYPEQPVVLNFLGFSWADQNRNLGQAHEMIQKALDQRPNDGEIVDSLGWVLLRQGDAHQAVKVLEKAAEMMPVDPTVTGHLGDAYWDAGRRLEAEDQWRRALVLSPEPAEAAPAKINLHLAITGTREDGYHLLDSLVVFAGAHDVVRAAHSDDALTLDIEGPFAAGLTAGPDNLVLRAARALAGLAGRPPYAKLVLEKNLPVASGIGGGSADAAAALRALARLWRLSVKPRDMHRLALSLGADVPVCLDSVPRRMGGIGDVLTSAPALPPYGMALINPGVGVATADVFRARRGPFSADPELPAGWAEAGAMARRL